MKKLIYSFLITALIAFTACSDKKEKDHSEDEMDQMSGTEETEDILVVNGVGGYGVEINGDDAKDLMVFASDKTAANGYTGKGKELLPVYVRIRMLDEIRFRQWRIHASIL
ncbi:MAG: hypothetical protein IPH61_15380 [Bacteroidetes bacterium]|nr:hypothetical protein [Bacteroidota bacterium]